MSISVEQPCYTLIHMPQDAEASNEMKFKEDLEKGDAKVLYRTNSRTCHAPVVALLIDHI
jgi:coatomer subunit beta